MLGEVVDHFRHLHPLTEALLFIKVGRRHQVDELVTAAGSRAGVLLEFGGLQLGEIFSNQSCSFIAANRRRRTLNALLHVE